LIGQLHRHVVGMQIKDNESVQKMTSLESKLAR
jgi:hypothetical protein